MKKKLLLTCLISLSSIGIANALCTPPATLKCECAHPIINAEGKLACGASYCGDKKCMPNGSCCPEANFCQVGNDKYCCAEGQTCDTASGCVDAKENIETLCANGGGTIISASSGSFCKSKDPMDWYQAKEWCLNNGMTMPTMYEMCPSWDGNIGNGKCSELSGKGINWVWSATIYPDDSESAFYVSLSNGYVDYYYRYDGGLYYGHYAFCRQFPPAFVLLEKRRSFEVSNF